MDDIKPRQPRQATKQPMAQPPVQPASQAPSPDSPEAAVAETPQEQKTRIKMDHKITKKRRGPMIAIVFAVVVTVGLIGGAVYLFWKSQQNKPVSSSSQTDTTNTQETVSAERLDVEDIDATNADIDKQLNTLDESNDFTSNDLSDSAIGL